MDIKVKSEGLHRFFKVYDEYLKKAIEKGMKATANRVFSHTLPNRQFENIRASKALNKKGINALKDRIKTNIVGNGKVGQGIATAHQGYNGKPIRETVDGNVGVGLYVRKTATTKQGRKHYAKFPVERSPQGVLSYIKTNTEIKDKNGTARRVKTKKGVFLFATRSAIMGAVKMLQKRAGQLLSGWSRLANLTQNTKLAGILSGQNVDGSGDATMTINDTGVKLTARDNAVAPAKESYQQKIIDDKLPEWVSYLVDNEVKHIPVARLLKDTRTHK